MPARKKTLRIKRWLKSGEIHLPCYTERDLLEKCGRALDHSCASEILGDVLFEGTDKEYYVVTVEAVVQKANPDYVKEVLKELEEEKG